MKYISMLLRIFVDCLIDIVKIFVHFPILPNLLRLSVERFADQRNSGVAEHSKWLTNPTPGERMY